MNKITAENFAKLINNRQYREEITEEEDELAENNNLVVVFGSSNDLIEFRGAFFDEFSAYDGESFYFDKDFKNISNKHTIVITENVVELDEIQVLRLNIQIPLQNKITQEWCPENLDTSWKISANFPHYTFNIYDDKDLYCIGIVFNIDVLK